MSKRRQLLKILATAGVFGPAGISGLIREALAAGNKPVAPGIHKVTGEVKVNGRSALVGMAVGPGDTVSTGAAGEVIYVIGQDAFLQRSDSIVSFGSDAAINLMRVVTGRILSVFGKGQRSIQVSTATIGIRGTGCYIEDEPAQKVGADGTAKTGTRPHSRTYFCLCYGSVELVPSAAPQERETFSTSYHDHPIYIHDDMKMPTMMVPAEVINHTDAELTLLENLTGRYPPFAGRSSY
jgi:hypothetical protein